MQKKRCNSREESSLKNVKKTNDEGAQIIQAEGKTKEEQKRKILQ